MALLLKKVERPRDLKWYQAAAMLYGDWGTSKAYVLGIAFALSGHGSWLLLGLMSLLTVLVGFCYTIICRVYPDGGGVYSSVKKRSQFVAVIGALLMVADYVVTASLSSIEAFHYFGFTRPEIWAIGSILVIGALNWFGPTKSGSIALAIGLLASLSAVVLFGAAIPHLPHVELTRPAGGWMQNWTSFVGIILALSGVEAVANMTGIMERPVSKTSRRAILPVLIEVAVLTFLLGLSMNAIPGLTNHTEDMLRALGNHYIGLWYGTLISIVFGFLLLSAANTAVTGLVSIQFLMAKDKELPAPFAKLNRYGMPWLSLVVSIAAPILVLIFEQDLVHLAALYAIGVAGAITINLNATATDFKLPLRKAERALLFVGGFIMLAIEITIAFQKFNALVFATIILATGLTLRQLAKIIVAPAITPEIVPSMNVLTVSEAKEIAPLYPSSCLVALKSMNERLLDEVVLRTKAQHEQSVYLAYVEESPPAFELPEEMEPSARSIETLAKIQRHLEAQGITAIPIWRLGEDPGRLIADAATELGVSAVMIGATRRSALENLIRGDVLRNLARNLPADCRLLISG